MPGPLVSPIGTTQAGRTEPLGQGFAAADLTLSSVTRSDAWATMDGAGNSYAITRSSGASSINESRHFSPANELLVQTLNGQSSELLYSRVGARHEDAANVYYFTAHNQLREVWRKQSPPVVAAVAANGQGANGHGGGAAAQAAALPSPTLSLACSYLYDGHGRRVARISDDNADGIVETVVLLLYAGQRVVEEFALASLTFVPEATGNLNSSRNVVNAINAGDFGVPRTVRDYFYGEGGIDDRLLFRRDVDGLLGLDESYSYLTNAYGSVFGIANALGQVVEAYDFTAYGRSFLIDAGPDATLFTADDSRTPFGAAVGSLFGNRYLFQGRRWEPAIGLYDYRARFFDPFGESWLTRDPAGFINGSNLYQFVGSMPWIADPMGLCGRVETAIQKWTCGGQSPVAKEVFDVIESEIVSWKPGRWESCPAMVGHQPEASLAWRAGNCRCEA